ncbi:MAG: right-handed parallel beta-helix repeat-containing protein [Patescibacteria group bacterium]|nr:right-handed parallel beta-helix repeat-containing protein [Patescibacteria group bacterium]
MRTLIVALCVFSMAGVGLAETYSVPDQYATIQAAIDVAEAGDVVSVGPGTYTDCVHEIGDQYGVIYHCVVMKSGVSLISEAGPETTIIDAQSLGRVILADSCDSGTRIEGFTIRGGLLSMRDGAGISCAYSEIEFVNDIITNNVGCRGGGVSISGGANHFSDCVFAGNQADYYGGGLYCAGSNSVFEDCRFSENIAHVGGGGVACVDSGGDPTFTRCLIDHNTCSSGGGGIWASNTQAVFNNCTVSDNEAERGASFYITCLGYVSFYCSILAYGIGPAVCCVCDSGSSFQCCDIFGHTFGDEMCGIDAGGNFSLDPEFSDRASGGYRLSATSPCQSGNHPTGCVDELIGAFPADQTPVEHCSWGSLKAMFR